ncbi:MAG: hypothetical protein AAFP17_11435 [Pseudomonadota bacterium]
MTRRIFAVVLAAALSLPASMASAIGYGIDFTVPCNGGGSACGGSDEISITGVIEVDMLGAIGTGDISSFFIEVTSPTIGTTTLTETNASIQFNDNTVSGRPIVEALVGQLLFNLDAGDNIQFTSNNFIGGSGPRAMFSFADTMDDATVELSVTNRTGMVFNIPPLTDDIGTTTFTEAEVALTAVPTPAPILLLASALGIVALRRRD